MLQISRSKTLQKKRWTYGLVVDACPNAAPRRAQPQGYSPYVEGTRPFLAPSGSPGYGRACFGEFQQ